VLLQLHTCIEDVLEELQSRLVGDFDGEHPLAQELMWAPLSVFSLVSFQGRYRRIRVEAVHKFSIEIIVGGRDLLVLLSQ